MWCLCAFVIGSVSLGCHLRYDDFYLNHVCGSFRCDNLHDVMQLGALIFHLRLTLVSTCGLFVYVHQEKWSAFWIHSRLPLWSFLVALPDAWLDHLYFRSNHASTPCPAPHVSCRRCAVEGVAARKRILKTWVVVVLYNGSHDQQCSLVMQLVWCGHLLSLWLAAVCLSVSHLLGLSWGQYSRSIIGACRFLSYFEPVGWGVLVMCILCLPAFEGAVCCDCSPPGAVGNANGSGCFHFSSNFSVSFNNSRCCLGLVTFLFASNRDRMYRACPRQRCLWTAQSRDSFSARR